ncbi:putative sensor histidine kinase NarS [Arthrobacter sp. Bi83]|uniref:sensor histidine kinase n=1 Tax=Arthrobacter sp. Bi83 TaxID=2822353 RepID=UPI001D90AC2B|nr:sensor histidine kinase [Arthrobacter sp. Bi83]CAH0224585.1 putative sensor histidine kinase NarS [Arthrobacter sp. Bi83]
MARPSLRRPVLFRPLESPASERSEVFKAVRRFLLMGLVALVVVITPVAFWIWSEAERHALQNSEHSTEQLAQNVVGPLLDKSVLSGNPAAVARLDARLRPWMDDRSVFEIRLWNKNGRIVYSEDPKLIGQTFELPGEAAEVLNGQDVPANLDMQKDEVSSPGASTEELVEVYVPVTAPNGELLVFEAYYDVGAVRLEQTAVLFGMAPPFLLALGVLQLAQLFPAVRLAKRIQAYEAARSRLLHRAIEASELERQRIARDLHDEVIQDLSGLSYVLESEELHGPVGQRQLFADARRILQDNVRSLRAMTSELYPPDLNRLGLSGALARLGDPLEERGISLALELPAKCELDRDRAALFYRVAREALANTAKHSKAANAELQLRQDGKRSEIRIHDDGCGFDQSLGSPEGHFGLRIMRDTICEAGGTLQVMSAPGRGTTVIARFGVGVEADLAADVYDDIDDDVPGDVPGVPQPVP